MPGGALRIAGRFTLTPFPQWDSLTARGGLDIVRAADEEGTVRQGGGTGMTSRDLVIGTLSHETVDRVPRDLWASARIEMFCEDELEEMLFCYPSDIQKCEFPYPRGRRARGTPGKLGRYTDAWGCTWRVTERGTRGQIVDHPLADPARIAGYRLPLELLEKLTAAQVSRVFGMTARFVLAGTQTRPLERLQALRGPEAARADLACGAAPVRDLLAMLHDFSCQEIARWAATEVDGVLFQDDWGTPDGLLVAPEIWRDLFKPLYRDYCEILRQGDKFAFFCSGGDIRSIFEDLLEIGIDAIDTQLLLADPEGLAARFRGRITFWADVEPEPTLARTNPEDCRAAVRRVRKALDYGQGGLIAKCRWDVDVPFENIAAVLEEWCQPVPTCF